jgi:hypothetical protein
MTTKTLRTRLLDLPGRMTTSAGRNILHLPLWWPWEEAFDTTLTKQRSLPQPGVYLKT